MRWCPDNELDRGDYTFEIVHAERFPFFWEIAWNIYQEYNQMTVYGDHKTKMTVHFDGSRVTVVSTENRLEQVTDNICESYTWCQVTPTPTQYPTRLPTPLPTPTESATVAPTAVVMPSPEAKTAMVAITYYDSGSNSWFKDYNQGTGYSITDRDGRKVYSRGLMCQYQAELTCWYELPVDTKLVFRIAGGMDSDSNQHHWSFCNKIGTAGQDQQLDFYLSDGLCIAESLYSSTLYCRDKLHITVASAGIVLLHGLADLSELSSSDEMALTWAISAIMGSQENLYVTYQYSRDLTFDALKVEFNVEVPTYLVGYDGSDPDNLVPAYRAVTEKLGDGFNSGRFVSYIEQFAVLHSGEALDIVNHGFVELEALQEGVLRDHTRWTNAPSPFYEDIPTSAPSKFSTPTPTQPGDMTSSKAGKPSSGHHHPSSTEETDWSSAVMISAAVVGVGLFLMFLLRNQNQSTADVVSDVQTRGGRKSAYRELSTDSYHGQGDRLVAGQDDDEEEGGAGPEVIKEILLAAAAETSKETRPLRLSRARKDESSNSSSSEGSDDDVDQEVRTGTARTKSSSTNSGKYSRSHTSSRKYRPPSNSKLRTSKR
ncbi:unnamed protein product [Symbiodinium microadriaticum]|nr:unnamed protein product [Symbiodinium microadriaticum]